MKRVMANGGRRGGNAARGHTEHGSMKKFMHELGHSFIDRNDILKGDLNDKKWKFDTSSEGLEVTDGGLHCTDSGCAYYYEHSMWYDDENYCDRCWHRYVNLEKSCIFRDGDQVYRGESY